MYFTLVYLDTENMYVSYVENYQRGSKLGFFISSHKI